MIFDKFDKENKGGLYYRDLLQLMIRNRNVRSALLCLQAVLPPHAERRALPQAIHAHACSRAWPCLPLSAAQQAARTGSSLIRQVCGRRSLTRSAGPPSSWSGPPCGCWSPTTRCGCGRSLPQLLANFKLPYYAAESDKLLLAGAPASMGFGRGEKNP